MADILLDVQGISATPSAGQAVLGFNNTTKALQSRNDAGLVRSYGVVNFSTASQAPGAASRTYIAGSNILIPAGALQVGSMFRWTFDMTKTAAGTAASTFDIAFGTLGTTGDTARASFTKPAGTAAIDNASVRIVAICRGPVGASGIVAGHFTMTHNLAATGHAVIPAVEVTTVSSAFDVATPTNIGCCITSGASDAITIQLVMAEAWNI